MEQTEQGQRTRTRLTLRKREDAKNIPKPVAFCGTRGLPARYGGFETAVDEITRRFVDEGLPCDVFCRRSSDNAGTTEHEGRRLVFVDGSSKRTLDTFVASIQTGFYLLKHRRRYSHVFWFNNANLPGILMTLFTGIPMTVNTDGLEWRRGKWSWPFKLYYFLSSGLISLVCRRLISDSNGIAGYYKKVFRRTTTVIPYGHPQRRSTSDLDELTVLNKYGLKPDRYFLQITRIEPDNYPLRAAQQFVASRLHEDGFRFLVVGLQAPTPYAEQLRALDGEAGVRVIPALYDPDELFILRKNCRCYVHGNSVGGTNPALLEAMAACPRIMAIDCVFSREVLGVLGTYFTPDDMLPAFIQAATQENRRDMLRRRVMRNYQWDAVAKAYMLIASGKPGVYTPSEPIEYATDHPTVHETLSRLLRTDRTLKRQSDDKQPVR